MVDDASPDHCPQILDSLAQTDDRINVLHRAENGRAGMARNDGLKLAEKGYVLFADADDLLQQDMCEKLLDLALEHDADIVACGWSIRDEDGNLVGRGYVPERHYELINSRDRARALRNLNYQLWNKLFRYEVIAPLRFRQFEANIGEDTLFNVEAFCRCRRLRTTSYCGYDYIAHAESATGRRSRGMPYLRTIAKSNECIRNVMEAEDGSDEGLGFADRLALKRYSTGLCWISANPDEEERARMFHYWRRHLREKLLPGLKSYSLMGFFFKWLAKLQSPTLNCNMSRAVLWLSSPLSHLDRWRSRVALSRNRSKPY
jgi:glycosyltransferase involved in cell wall biosynthesis